MIKLDLDPTLVPVSLLSHLLLSHSCLRLVDSECSENAFKEIGDASQP